MAETYTMTPRVTHLIIDIPGISPMHRLRLQEEADRWLEHGGALVLGMGQKDHARIMTIPAESIGCVMVESDD